MPATKVLPSDLNLNADVDIESSAATTTLEISNAATDGDPQLAFALSGTKYLTMGIDDSDGDSFKMGTTSVSTYPAFIMDSSGQLTYPYQPCFSAYLSAYQYNIADNGTIIFDAEAFDVGYDFNTTTGTFTAPVTGKYLLTYSVDVSSLDSAASYYWLKLLTSNRNYYAPFIPTSLLLSSDGRMTFQNTVVADMDASDTAYITLDRSGGVTQADIVGGASQYSWFHGYLLG